MSKIKDVETPLLNMEAPFICPECRDEDKGKAAEFGTYQKRYQHRRKVHGIVPLKKYAKSSEKKSIVKVEAKHAPNSLSPQNDTISRNQADAENLINLIAGCCLEQIRSYAAEFGIPKAVITEGVIGIFHSSTSGAVHGSRYRMPALRS